MGSSWDGMTMAEKAAAIGRMDITCHRCGIRPGNAPDITAGNEKLICQACMMQSLLGGGDPDPVGPGPTPVPPPAAEPRPSFTFNPSPVVFSSAASRTPPRRGSGSNVVDKPTTPPFVFKASPSRTTGTDAGTPNFAPTTPPFAFKAHTTDTDAGTPDSAPTTAPFVFKASPSPGDPDASTSPAMVCKPISTPSPQDPDASTSPTMVCKPIKPASGGGDGDGGAADLPRAAAVLSDALGTDVAGIVGGFLACTRCGEPCTPGSRCRVPHPAHLRQELQMMTSHDGMRATNSCKACSRTYHVITPWNRPGSGNASQPGETRIEGPEWCFEGAHTTDPLPDSDRRRVERHAIAIEMSERLQQDIEAVPADVRSLHISSGMNYMDDHAGFTLERSFPDLTDLQLVDVPFTKIVLNKELTPSLRNLRMQNVPDECDLTLELPNLRKCQIHFLGDCDEVINEMLAGATSLEEFESYKLWVSELHFASNHLVEVDLHRSDALDTLTLYAPNLRTLGLQACYGLDTLVFRDSHPHLSASLPPNHRPPPLAVNTVNANLGPRARRALNSHPSVVRSRTQHQGMPTEGMFAHMNGMMNGMMGGFYDEDDYDYSSDDPNDDHDGFPVGGMMPPFGGMMGGYRDDDEEDEEGSDFDDFDPAFMTEMLGGETMARLMMLMAQQGPDVLEDEGAPPGLRELMMALQGMPAHLGEPQHGEDEAGGADQQEGDEEGQLGREDIERID